MVQLYVYLNPTPKWGYIVANTESDGKVKFRECNSKDETTVDKGLLEDADGNCNNASPRKGTWVAVLARRRPEQ
jgi:hypothetical protein